MKRLLLYLLVLVLPVLSSAQQTDARKPINIVSSSQDPLGTQITYQLKEQLGRSALYRLGTGDSSKGWTIHIITIDPSPGNDGVSTAGAAVLTVSDYYITSQVFAVGRDKVMQEAAALMAFIDSTVTEANKH